MELKGVKNSCSQTEAFVIAGSHFIRKHKLIMV